MKKIFFAPILGSVVGRSFKKFSVSISRLSVELSEVPGCLHRLPTCCRHEPVSNDHQTDEGNAPTGQLPLLSALLFCYFLLVSVSKNMIQSTKNTMKPTNPTADTFIGGEKQYLSHFLPDIVVGHPDMTH